MKVLGKFRLNNKNTAYVYLYRCIHLYISIFFLFDAVLKYSKKNNRCLLFFTLNGSAQQRSLSVSVVDFEQVS